MNKAVFLDRDGVINKEKKDYVKSVNELEIYPQIPSFIKKIKELGFIVIVITNQSAINRKLTTKENVNKIHKEIQKLLKLNNTKIDDFFYCPHMPEENCECRKPKSGLILQAQIKFNIDLKKSWVIGDNESDVESGTNIGCKGIKIESPDSLNDVFKQISFEN